MSNQEKFDELLKKNRDQTNGDPVWHPNVVSKIDVFKNGEKIETTKNGTILLWSKPREPEPSLWDKTWKFISENPKTIIFGTGLFMTGLFILYDTSSGTHCEYCGKNH